MAIEYVAISIEPTVDGDGDEIAEYVVAAMDDDGDPVGMIWRHDRGEAAERTARQLADAFSVEWGYE
jgi:hypothetical protein